MFFVSSQNELLPKIIEEPDAIKNGLQAEVDRMHLSVLCVTVRLEAMIVRLDALARKAAPDASIINEALEKQKQL